MVVEVDSNHHFLHNFVVVGFVVAEEHLSVGNLEDPEEEHHMLDIRHIHLLLHHYLHSHIVD